MSRVDVKHNCPAFQAWLSGIRSRRKSVGHFQLNAVGLLLQAVVKDNKFRPGKGNELFAVQPVFMLHQVFLVGLGKVEKAADRHIGIQGALVFIKIEDISDEEGDIIFHFQIKHVFQRHDRKLLRVGIGAFVYRII